jgi:hypothetical protein
MFRFTIRDVLWLTVVVVGRDSPPCSNSLLPRLPAG